MAKQPDYEVGYGKPPEHTRFKKGRSGNPKGRPKGSKNVQQIIADVLMAPVAVNANGKRKKVPAIKVFVTNVRNNALKGDAKATQHMLRLMTLTDRGPGSNDNDASPATPEDDLATFAAQQREIYDLFRADPDRDITMAEEPDTTDQSDEEGEA